MNYFKKPTMATDDNTALNELKNVMLDLSSKMDKHKQESDAKSDTLIETLQASIMQVKKDLDQKLDTSFNEVKGDISKINERIRLIEADLAKNKAAPTSGTGASGSGGPTWPPPGFGANRPPSPHEVPGHKRGRREDAASRPHSQPPPPPPQARTTGATPTTSNDDLKFAIFVGGFQREVPRHFREAQAKLMLAKVSPNTRPSVHFRASYMAKYFYLECPSLSVFREVMDSISAHSWSWHDPTFNDSYELHVRRHKTLQQRELGKFRSYFYAAIKARLDQNIELKDNFTLKIIKGTLYIEHDTDALPLLHFSRNIIMDSSGYDIDFNTFSKFGIDKEEVNAICEAALTEAEEVMD